jgi:hypothetical protein
MAKNCFKLIVSLLAVSAVFGSPVMTRPGFYAIDLGDPVNKIIQDHGEPYSIKVNKDGSKDYLYIERIPVGEQTVEENRYILVIKNGQVVSKRYNQELPPPYDEIYDDDPNDVPN